MGRLLLQELVGLVPDLGGRLRCLKLEVLQGIWRDEAIPDKLVELKLQFLEVDVSRLVARRSVTSNLSLEMPVKCRQVLVELDPAALALTVALFRPSILIDKNLEAVPEATAYLQQFVSPAELNDLVERQPWFLAAHLEEYLAGYST